MEKELICSVECFFYWIFEIFIKGFVKGILWKVLTKKKNEHLNARVIDNFKYLNTYIQMAVAGIAFIYPL